MLIYLYHFFSLVAVLVLLYSMGLYIVTKTSNEKWLNGFEILVGFSITIIFLSLYTVLSVPIRLLSFIALILGSFALYWVFSKQIKLKQFHTNFNLLLVSLIPIAIFLIIAVIYDPNFYVFRGNIWDWFNYNTMAVAYSKYVSGDFFSMIQDANPLGYIAEINLSQRPSVVLLPAAIMSTGWYDNFLLMYLYKGLLLSILFSSLIQYSLSQGFSRLPSFCLAISITFSSWIFYIVEIDALSNLAYLPFIPFIATYLKRTKNLQEKNSFVLFGVITSASFLIYPELSSILICSLILSYLIANFMNEKKLNFMQMKSFFHVIWPFGILMIIYFDQSVLFIIKQIVGGFSAKNDWWGYYGGYILGPNSPVTDSSFISDFRADLAGGVSIYKLFGKLLENHFLSILPAVFGFFHLLTINYFAFPLTLITIFIVVLFLNWIFKFNNDVLWIKVSIFLLGALVLLLVLRGNLWSAVKGFSWILLLLPLAFISIYSTIKNQFFSFLMFVFFLQLPFFTVYKYSEYNSGIGVYDGFPSILKTSFKEREDWVFDSKKYIGCNRVLVKIEDPFKRHFYFLNFESRGIAYTFSEPILTSYGVGDVIAIPDVVLQYDCIVKN